MEDTNPGPRGTEWGRCCGRESRRGGISSPFIITVEVERGEISEK